MPADGSSGGFVPTASGPVCGLTPPLPSASPDVLCLHSGVGVPVPLFVRMLDMSDGIYPNELMLADYICRVIVPKQVASWGSGGQDFPM